MRKLRDIPIRFKLVVLMAGTSSLVLTMVCALFVLRDIRLIRANMLQQYKTAADLLGNSATAALSFDDPATGNEVLASLRLARDVRCAAILNQDGSEFARYVRVGESFTPPEKPFQISRNVDTLGDLVVLQPIDLDGTPLGLIYLRADSRQVNEQIRGDVLLAVAVLLVAILASIGISARLQRTISSPVDALVIAAKNVTSESDYGVRVDLKRKDEFQTLGQAFNTMLAEIEVRESELTTKNQMLRRAKDEMQQFVYTVSHDLKSPLVTCRGFLGIMREDAEEENWADMLDSVARMEGATERMAFLIDDLLELSRIGVIRNEPQHIDVKKLVHSIVDGLKPRLDASGASCTIGDLPPVTADRVRLGEVFENLLSNAVKYACDGEHPRIIVGGKKENGEVRYFVKDSGPGIAAEYQEKIFGLFQRLETDKEGTGVGLAVVARIMETHGGKFGVESTVGEGAQFWVSFPLEPRIV